MESVGRVIQHSVGSLGMAGCMAFRLFHTLAWWPHALRVTAMTVIHDSKTPICNPNLLAIRFPLLGFVRDLHPLE